MVLSSAAASTLTTILPTARTSLAMAAYEGIPSALRPHPPQVSYAHLVDRGMAVVSIAFYVAMTAVSTNVLGGHHLVPRADDRLLLRTDRVGLRVVVPQGPNQRWPGPVPEGDPARSSVG